MIEDPERRRKALQQFIEAKGLNVNAWAVKSNVRESTVRGFLARKSESMTLKTYEKLAKGGDTTVAVLTGDAPIPDSGQIFEPVQVRGGSNDYMPVVGAGQGAKNPDQDGFELNSTVVDRVRRPPGLVGVADAYGLFVQGESMVPRYFAGDLVYIHPHRPVNSGSFVVVQLRPKVEGDPIRALIKRLVRRQPNKITLEQYNPAKSYEIAAADVFAIHLIMNGEELFR